MRLLVLVALIAACASPEPANDPPPDGLVEVTGTVTSVDLEPMAYDGDAIVQLQTGEQEKTVRVPARMGLCKAFGLALVRRLQPGDVIEVRGEGIGGDSVTPCASSEHGIVLRSTSGGTAYRGVFESGFETSAFLPCDQPGVQWWLDGDQEFYDRFEAIRQQHAPGGGRGERLFVEATAVGELTDEGEYGHLGQYSHRFTVTETREMVFLAANPDSTVSCR